VGNVLHTPAACISIVPFIHVEHHMCAAVVGDVSKTPGTGASTSVFMSVKGDMSVQLVAVALPISAAYEHTIVYMLARNGTHV